MCVQNECVRLMMSLTYNLWIDEDYSIILIGIPSVIIKLYRYTINNICKQKICEVLIL